jgi:hypothetical protein
METAQVVVIFDEAEFVCATAKWFAQKIETTMHAAQAMRSLRAVAPNGARRSRGDGVANRQSIIASLSVRRRRIVQPNHEGGQLLAGMQVGGQLARAIFGRKASDAHAVERAVR